MQRLPKSSARFRIEQEPGTWRKVEHEDGTWSVQIRCPFCKKHATLRRSADFKGKLGHDVSPTGFVNPSLVCPHHKCSWHVFAVLDGWES